MEIQAWHINIEAQGRLPLFSDEAALRRGVRALVASAGIDMVLFNVVDEHAHWVTIGAEALVRQQADAVARALGHCTVVPLEQPFLKPVANRAHMQTLVPYLLDQTGHHGLPVHPAIWTGGCFQDLVGARVMDGFGNRIIDILPRFRLREAYSYVGLETMALVEPSPDAVRNLGARRVAHAAFAALAVGPGFARYGRGEALARHAAVAVAREAGICTGEIGWGLQATDRTVQRLSKVPANPKVQHATLLQLALELRAEASCLRAFHEQRIQKELERRRQIGR